MGRIHLAEDELVVTSEGNAPSAETVAPDMILISPPPISNSIFYLEDQIVAREVFEQFKTGLTISTNFSDEGFIAPLTDPEGKKYPGGLIQVYNATLIKTGEKYEYSVQSIGDTVTYKIRVTHK